MKRFLTFAAAAVVPSLLAAQAPKAAASVAVPAAPLAHKHTPRPTTAEITAADLMTRLYIFADDSMMGREAGTLGNVKGTDYIAAEVKKMGLVPAGEDGGYFQTIPLKTRMVDSSSTLSVAGSPLAFGTEWAVSGTAPATIAA
ncbi:MAG: hypothetical protein ACJ79K_17845, partial [Gemmatimonadaceae bacterium]